jgi:outer membrane protein assembly factor BamB
MIQSGPRLRTAASLMALIFLAACASKKASEKPAELTEFVSTAKVQQVWSASVGGAKPKLRLGLSIATDGKAVYAAGYNGEVTAFDATTGRRLWQSKTKLKLTGGPGAGEGLVVAGASHGDIIALDAATGAQKWKSRINSEILAAPAIGKGVVLVRAVDGRMVALRASDGGEIWSAEQQVPRLSLRGTAKPIIFGDLALSGFDTGRVLALTLADGAPVWDVNVAPPTGRSEIERLNDIDSAIKAVGTDVYAVTYHGKVARLDLETGQVQWSRDTSSYSGLATDEDALYVASADGAVLKIGRRNGVEVWKQEVLARRRLSPPEVISSLVAVADYDGYVHFFDPANGELAARVHPLGERVTAAPLVIGDLLIVMDDDGKIVALRVTPAAAKS